MSQATQQGFNAASKAREREARPVTIGEGDQAQTFYPRRRTAPVMAAFRQLLRADVKLAVDQQDLAPDDIEGRAEIEEQREGLLFDLISVLIRPADGEGEAPAGLLADELDIDDARELLSWLMPKGDDEADPSQETATSTG